MATVGSNFNIEDEPSNFRSAVWLHLGFPVYTDENGEKQTDKTKTACKYCKRMLTYTSNRSNMLQLINQHHGEHSLLPSERKLQKGQTTLTSGFAFPLTHNTAKVQEITRAVGYFIAEDLSPFTLVENEGFWLLMNALKPRCSIQYRIPSHQHFSQALVPELYREFKADVVEVFQGADSVSSNVTSLGVTCWE